MEFLPKDNLKFFTIEQIDFISQDQPFLQNTRTHKLFLLESIKPQKLSELAKLYNILLAIEHQIVPCALASKKNFFPSYASDILCPGNNAKSDIYKLPDIFIQYCFLRSDDECLLQAEVIHSTPISTLQKYSTKFKLYENGLISTALENQLRNTPKRIQPPLFSKLFKHINEAISKILDKSPLMLTSEHIDTKSTKLDAHIRYSPINHFQPDEKTPLLILNKQKKDAVICQSIYGTCNP